MSTEEVRQNTAGLIRQMRASPTPAATALPTQTGYGIRNVVGGFWLADNRKWVDNPDHARQFHFVISAEAYAVSLGLDPNTYKVESL